MKAMDVDSVIRLDLQVELRRIADYLEIKVYLVDSDDVLSSIVLLRTRQEALCEEESRDPEGWRSSVVDPFLHESESCNEVDHPGC